MKEPRHIVHIIYQLHLGGMETMLADIANEQCRRGLRVTVIVVNDEVDPLMLRRFEPAVRVVTMRRRRGSRPLLMMARLNILVSRLRPDVVHLHQPNFRKLLRVCRNRQVLTVHDINTPLEHVDAACPIAAITEAVRADVLNRRPDARVEVLLNGICTSTIAPRGDRRPAPANFRIVQLARLNYEKKGQDILIDALGELRRRGRHDISVDFIGGGVSDEPLRQRAAACGVTDAVHFLGLMDRDEVYRRLADYDAMVHPSRYEGFGLIIAEAMCAGLPVVVTRNDGPWEVADRGRLCESITLGDAIGLADTIEAMIAGYPAVLARAAEARVYAQRYGIERTVDAYLELYRRLGQ